MIGISYVKTISMLVKKRVPLRWWLKREVLVASACSGIRKGELKEKI
jgi:hypothetical protein